MANKLVDIDALESLARKISEKYASKEEVSSKLSSVYTPGGSKDSLSSDLLTKENLGKVYNMTQEFTTNGTDFVEDVGKKYPAGTNVVVVDVGSETYKFDVLSGFVDLTGYVTDDGVSNLIDNGITNRIANSGEVDSMLNGVFGDG